MKDKWLLRLADDILQKLPNEQFDYFTFVGEDWKGKADLSCNTTACAGGWASTMRPLRRMGLRLVKRYYDGAGSMAIVPTAQNCLTQADIDNRKLDSSFNALAYIFDINMGEARYLFSPNSSLDGTGLPISPKGRATPRQVAAHIRQFVQYKKKMQEMVG
jgi:hypothetical protein